MKHITPPLPTALPRARAFERLRDGRTVYVAGPPAAGAAFGLLWAVQSVHGVEVVPLSEFALS